MSFKKIERRITRPKDPESLFLDLRSRSPEIQHLWAHQADILREYFTKHLKTQDISFELPTGTGKTLIGLLIGEWRRLFYNERVLYLCPTRQLAHQVHDLSYKYGIKAHVFVGKQSKYDEKKFSEYKEGQVIAISTYSSLFNVNPRLNDANVIILDDSHAAENYIISMWSLTINRFKHKDLYFKILDLFSDVLSKSFIESIKKERFEIYKSESVNMIPIQYIWEYQDSLVGILNANITRDDPSLYFPWSILQHKILACNIFISYWNINIRPWIPPSLAHPPFKNTKQRIYMSATLGAGGELERAIGIPRIERIKVPPGWDKQGLGRRFFLFPDYSFNPSEYTKWLVGLIYEKDRTLILCPDRVHARYIEDGINSYFDEIEILNATDIEDSISEFTSKEKVVLLLTNRYDGIDLPDDSCRQLIINGLPAAVNLQERFLLYRLNIYSLLKDRLITRFIQATGRCTRSSTDYALIILVGHNLFDFYVKIENRGLLHPELQAEIEFGLQQSNVSEINDLSVLIDLFFQQGNEWIEAEKDIKGLREDLEVIKDIKVETYYAIVKKEVEFIYSLWRLDFEYALDLSRQIGDELSGEEFEGYRALWNYFTGSIAWILGKKEEKKEFYNISRDFYSRAKSCSKLISWFSEIPQPNGKIKEEIDYDSTTAYAIERIQRLLNKLGGAGRRFEDEMNRIQELINKDKYSSFEEGLTALGELLGFKSHHTNDTAAPDSVWQIEDSILLLFEAKSEESEEDGISVSTCRQAYGHYNWAKTNFPLFDKIKKKITIIITRRTKLDKQAQPHAEDLYYLGLDRIRKIFTEITGILRRIRTRSIEYNEDELRIRIYEQLTINNLDPESIIKEFLKYPISKLMTKPSS